MTMIRVAHVVTRLDWGGVPEIIRTLCTGTDPARFELTLITGATRHPSKKTNDFFQEWKGTLIVVPELMRNVNLWQDTVAFFKLRDIFRRGNFDIVHTHTAKAGALGRFAAQCAQVKVIVHTPHGHNFYGYFRPLASWLLVRIERFLGSFTNAIIALTELEKKDLLRYKVGTEKSLRVIYQGLDLTQVPLTAAEAEMMKKKFGITAGQPVVGMVGRLEPIKDPCTFVQAASLIALKIPDVKFILIGEGSMRGQIQFLVNRLGLADRFLVTGWLDNSVKILPLFDIMALCSLNEAVGIVLIEAQSQGIPVVATRVGGIPEVVQDGITGILVPARDPAQLANAVCLLLEDGEKKSRMQAAGRAWVADKFCARTMIEKIENLYDELRAPAG